MLGLRIKNNNTVMLSQHYLFFFNFIVVTVTVESVLETHCKLLGVHLNVEVNSLKYHSVCVLKWKWLFSVKTLTETDAFVNIRITVLTMRSCWVLVSIRRVIVLT